jgi:hypothetical protein
MASDSSQLPIDEHAKTIREMVQHENTLQNYRITWLMTIQGLLFAGLAFAWDKQDARYVVVIFALLGVLVAVSCWSALRLGNRAFHELHAWWEPHRPTYQGPPVSGHQAPSSGIMWWLRPWRLLPWVFVCGWIGILGIAITRRDEAAKARIVINQERQLDMLKAEFK